MAQTMRRIMWLSVLGGVAAAGWSFFSSKQSNGDGDKGNWAPVPAPSDGPAGATAPQRFSSDSSAARTSATPSSSSSNGSAKKAAASTSAAAKSTATKAAATKTTSPKTAGASKTSAAKAAPGKKLWVEPDAKGSCPADFPVKGNQSSKIYHVPTGGSYDRTKAERCYATPEDAEADGYRASKR